MVQMRHFVNDHVVEDVFRCHHELPVEGDSPFDVAFPPHAFVFAEKNALWRASDTRAKERDPLGEHCLRFRFIPAQEGRSNTAGAPFGCLAPARMHDERPFDEFSKRLAAVNDL